jgi:hypothetical protein
MFLPLRSIIFKKSEVEDESKCIDGYVDKG